MTTPSDSIPITPNQRAGHVLRVKAPALAEVIVAEHFRRRPELTTRYGAAGRRHCLADARYHLHFLAAAAEFNDASVFADYVEWVIDLLTRRAIPAGDVGENLRVVRAVLGQHLPGPVWVLVEEHLQAGIDRADSTVAA